MITLENGYVLDDDPARLDVDRIHRWLSEDCYWALGRSREKVASSLRHSRVVAAYTADGVGCGVSRVVTDDETFAWLADVYVEPEHRGRGLARAMVSVHVERLRARGLRRILLATSDAHGVYAEVGFGAPVEPEKLMELRFLT